jgi:serine/threonine protein kinase
LEELNKDKFDSNIELHPKIASEWKNFERSLDYLVFFKYFEEISFLGQGNFALVFKAKNRKENQISAIQKIPLKLDFKIDEIKYIKIILNLEN